MRWLGPLIAIVFLVGACGPQDQRQVSVSALTFRSTIEVVDHTFAPAVATRSIRFDRIDGSHSDGSVIFDADSRTKTQLFGETDATRETNTSLSRPDVDEEENTTLAQYVVANAKRATPTTYSGRAALALDVENRSVAGEFDHAAVTVDNETGLPLRVTTKQGEKVLTDWQVTDFRAVDAGPTFVPSLDDREVQRSNDGFVDTQWSLVKDQVGYEPFTVSEIPPGFELTHVLTRRSRGEPTGADGSNPDSGRVLVMQYVKDWQRLAITMRPTDASTMAWGDPFASQRDEFFGDTTPLVLTSGALANSRGQVVVSGADVPHLWAVTPQYVITISGSVTAEQLVTVARGLVNQ